MSAYEQDYAAGFQAAKAFGSKLEEPRVVRAPRTEAGGNVTTELISIKEAERRLMNMRDTIWELTKHSWSEALEEAARTVEHSAGYSAMELAAKIRAIK